MPVSAELRLLFLSLAFGTACGASDETLTSDPAAEARSASGWGSPWGTVSARPQRVSVPASGLGITTICYSSSVDWSQVFVSENGASDHLFMMEQHQGCSAAPWIQVGHTYDFRVYAGTQHGQILANVTVVGVLADGPPDPCSQCPSGTSCRCGSETCERDNPDRLCP